MEEAQVLKVREAAEILGMTTDTVQLLLKNKKIPGKKIGGHWRIPRQELMEFIKKPAE